MRTVAQHFADALADVAVSQNAADQVRRELGDVLGLLRESPQLGLLLGSPAVSRANKQAVVEALVAGLKASRTMRNFLSVVLDRRRMRQLPEIQQAIEAQLDERQGITRAAVTSARELDVAEKTQLRGALETPERPARGSRVQIGPRAYCRSGGSHRLDDL